MEIVGIISMVLAIIGVLLNNRKLIACFYLWLVSNALSAGIHFYAGIWSLFARDMIFFGLAVEGMIRWRKK
jgi:nicotinamide riboside transporter PnuC